MPDPRQTLGKRGESWVTARLICDGYTILDRNWRCSLGELDIVARHDDQIVFVEVRTRRGPLHEAIEWALDSVNEQKQARLIQLAEAYLAAHDLESIGWRIDTAAVALDRGQLSWEILHHDW
jgi:putative endonuclease